MTNDYEDFGPLGIRSISFEPIKGEWVANAILNNGNSGAGSDADVCAAIGEALENAGRKGAKEFWGTRFEYEGRIISSDDWVGERSEPDKGGA